LSSFSLIGETYAVLSAICWAVATVLFTKPSRQLRPEAINLFKTTLAAALLVITLIPLRGQEAFRVTSQTEALYLAAGGFLGISISDTLFFWCLREIGAWRTLVLGCLAPLMTVAFSAVVLRDPMGGADVLGMVVALAGVILAIVGGRARGEDGRSFTRMGIVVGACMSISLSLGIIFTKIGTVETVAFEASVIRIVVAVPGILLIEAVRQTLGITLRSALRPSGLPNLIAGSVTGTCIAYLLFIAGIKYAHPGVANALASTAPAFVIPLSAVFLKERVSLLAIIGTGVALIGIAILFVF
jgi:DME family drug/metabolite transporter